MDKLYEQKAPGSARTNSDQRPERADPAPDYRKTAPVAEPAPQDVSEPAFELASVRPAVRNAPRAADSNSNDNDYGNADEVMSGQQDQAMPGVDEADGKWKQQVGAAKAAWSKLSEEDLLEAAGHEEKLAELVQEGYTVTRDEAERQVKEFFDKN